MRGLGDGKALAGHVATALADALGALRTGLIRTWRAIYATLDQDRGLGTLAVVSMLVFQLAVGTAGLKLIAETRLAHEPTTRCAAGSCAIGASGTEPLTATPTATRALGGLRSHGIVDASPTEGDDQQTTSTTNDSTVEPDTQSGPPPQDEAAPAPGADAEAPAAAVEITPPLFEATELPAPTELFDLPLDPTVQDLPTRRMPYEEFAEHGSEMLARLPSLEALHAYFPENPMTSHVEEQKQHILYLAEQVEVSVEGYRRLGVDMTRRTAFRDLANYHDEIEPKMFVVHWTGMGYRGVDHFVSSMKPHRVQYFIDRNARVFQLFESDTNWPAHALGANDFAQGVEIETGPFDEQTSPLFSYTPDQIEHTIYVAVDFLRRNELDVDETTLVGHYAADLLFTNPYYDPHEGRFTRDRIRKFDPPQELMQVIVHKAQQLDATLDAQ